MFEPVTVNKQTINWGVYSGLAIGVQKYTKTHVSGGEYTTSTIETIIELSIQKNNGDEAEMTIKREKIRVRDGQRVSGIFGYTESEKSNWLIFVNHDAEKWYWLDTPRSFFESLGVFRLLSPLWLISFIVILIISVIARVVSGDYSHSPIWTTIGIIVGIIGIIFCIVQFILQRHRVNLAWNTIEPQIIQIARELRY
ncbi:hypothetical protein [Nostoc sp.]|uniref:hypothetical protein n=1 Tax=Nostoc sp. TaxID=1180 RepID=UPI002FF622E4